MSLIFRLVFAALLMPATVLASDPYVPSELQDWQEWVLKDKEYRGCPFIFNHAATERNDFICAWPGKLELSVDADGGQFTQQWTVYADQQWIQLPGNTNFWPHRVTGNGRSLAVVLHNNVPSAYLTPGSYRIAGSFEWDERPGNLRLPRQTGLISLTVNGQAVARPERTRSGVFLGERRAEAQSRDTVEVNVYRLVSDDVPTRLTTRLEIQVSGSVREELFGPLLPEGFVPLVIESELPARLEPDGNLRVQVRPGSWNIELTARAAGVLDVITMPTPETNLSDTEIWSYRSNDMLRVTTPEGLPPVDPLQVGVPGNWTKLPAFRMTSIDSMKITERSRGIVSAENDLNLSRTMWMDFDRSGFVVSDRIVGTMRSDWRLDMSSPFSLLTASVNGENLLITDGDSEGRTGVELRYPNLELATVGRSGAGRKLPVTGWDARFASARTILNLPPGHKLLAAPGVDRASGSWASRWQLLDFFLVLIITISAWRLFGPTAGVIALAALALSFHEINAPAWLWLNILIAIALLRVAPAGRLQKTVRVYQVTSAALLVLMLVPFIAEQLRIAIYPQLESQRGMVAQSPASQFGRGAMDKLMMAVEDADKATKGEIRSNENLLSYEQAAKVASLVSYSRYAPNAIVQVGTGIPSWQWNSYRLSWSGPVDADQTMQLIIMPRWLVSSLRLLEVVMLLLFSAVLAAEILKRQFKFPGGLQIGASTAGGLIAVGLIGLLLGAGQSAQAQLPDAELLKDLETRLLQPPECTPRCAEIVAADIDIGEHSVRISLTVYALEEVAVPLPGSDAGWRPAAILLDGTAAGQVSRGPDQSLWIRLQAGRHKVILSGPIPAVDSLEIPFPAPPRVVDAVGDGWFIAGIKDRRLLSGSLQLTRLQSADIADGSLRWESSRFPPFVEVTRTLELDLDWGVRTDVSRVAPAQGALTLELPLIEGESVISENATVKDGKILVTMAPNVDRFTWQSTLERKSLLTLEASNGVPWREIWRVVVSGIWHVEFDGVPESESAGGGYDARMANFYPRAGESLALTATRPEGSAGKTLAFDSVDLHVQHGDRSITATLALEYRSTRGAQHVLQLPIDAEVTRVSIDGQTQSLRADDGALTVPILPGEHTIELSWRSDGEVMPSTKTPIVNIRAPASNISIRMDLPRNRWLLATRGPSLGPAVLYWSELAVLILAAIILGRTGLAPLKTWHWLLLGLGFSTFAWPALGTVVLWLLVSGARERWNGQATWWQFNLIQLAYATLTVVALMTIVTSLPGGLLGTPDMNVTGNGSYGNSLKWFVDRSDSVLPTASAWTVPLWVYKTLILGWALWLSFALLRWLPWVWRCFSSQGYWRSRKQTVS